MGGRQEEGRRRNGIEEESTSQYTFGNLPRGIARKKKQTIAFGFGVNDINSVLDYLSPALASEI